MTFRVRKDKMELKLAVVCFLVSCVAVVDFNVNVVFAANVGCQHVKYAFTTKGLNANDAPHVPMTGELKIV